LPPGNDDLVGATEMVESVRAGGVGGPSPLGRNGIRTAEGPFSVGDGATPPTRNAGLSSVASIGLDSMLALQGIDEAIEHDRAAHKRGTAMLAALTRLQRMMLAAEDPSAALRALNELTADNRLADDPGLGAILRAVVLRSRVEMARREAFHGRRDGA
jgi:hypothetical protein